MKKNFGLYIIVPLVIIFAIILMSFLSRNEPNGEKLPALTFGMKEKSIKVGIQAGHWKNNELPDEFKTLRAWGGGAFVGKTYEWEVNLAIARKIADILKKNNIEVDILPATIPPNYSADAFVALHTDGNDVTSVSGYKVAASKFDESNKAKELSDFIETDYGILTKLRLDPNVTADMTEYYVFNSDKYTHTINSKTPGAIIEMAFLTNAGDRKMLLNDQDTLAQGIANGIEKFLDKTK